jgi:cytochrome c-type biogenesis protein CcmF
MGFREIIGQAGHFFVVLSFVAAGVATFGFWRSYAEKKPEDQKSWRDFGRKWFLLHGFSVTAVVTTLFSIIHNHYYEYHYAWSHSSNLLPVYYMISCFWEGQEGSFLLWIFWHVLIGLLLIYRKTPNGTEWEAPVMSVISAVQVFLASMILGSVLPGIELKIGSSPFILLRDAMPDAPIFKTNPNFIPEDGTGLNPLLQNYWMVIHPPTLFLGFAITVVPFAYVISGILLKKYKEWIKPAFAWALVAAAVLGIGIMMGAYWAYETLNFGGYWNWDPVENAVYVPWLVLVGAIHLMTSHQKNALSLRWAGLLTILTFILILYSTFLTRSGILGEASVHSFTDLGLSGQLLIYLAFFKLISVYLLAKHWKAMGGGKTEKDPKPNSGEFWIFIGVMVLLVSAFQIIIPTSIPVYNKLLGFIGIESNMAPPADQVEFYNKFQIWFGMLMALGSATAQFFWWKNIQTRKQFTDEVALPLSLTFTATSLAVIFGGMKEWQYILLLTTSFYGLFSAGTILIGILRRNTTIAGGSVAHTGLALMLIGILASSGYSKIISLNNTGSIYSKDFSEETNRENLLLFHSQPERMSDYTLTYTGVRKEIKGFPEYVPAELLIETGVKHLNILKEDLTLEGTTYFKKGDTVEVFFENSYYEIKYAKANAEVFTLYPRIQENEQMGSPVVSPDIKRGWLKDLYTHATAYPDPTKERKWSEPEKMTLAIGDTFMLNDFVAILDDVLRGNPIDNEDFMIYAKIRVLDRDTSYVLKPVFQIKENMARKIPEMHEAVAAMVTLEEILPAEKKFVFSVRTTQKDWIIIKAVEKPFINLLWLGTLMVAFGFILAAKRRFTEYSAKSVKRNREEETEVVKH